MTLARTAASQDGCHIYKATATSRQTAIGKMTKTLVYNSIVLDI